MVFRRTDGETQEEQEDGLNIISEDDDDESTELFEEGQPCDVCGAEEGRIGIDPTARGAYDGDPVLAGANCVEQAMKDAYAGIDGIAVIVEPFGEYTGHYYYRLDELQLYQFVRDDIEALSWLLLTIGDACARCGEQSHFAWLTRESVDAKLPEDRAIFRNLDSGIEHLCNACAAAALVESYTSLKLPLMTVEVPRSAMGILMPVGD